MPFLSITVKNYRNLADRILDVAYPEIFLIGKNGQGKTNLLDAIYLLAYGNSFRTKIDSEICKRGSDSFFVSAIFRERERCVPYSFSFVAAAQKRNNQKRKKSFRPQRVDNNNSLHYFLPLRY